MSLPGNDNFGGSLPTMPFKCNFFAITPTGLSAGLVATLTITFELKMYEEKKTQKTSYINKPVKRSVETFKLGSLTKAINATQRPIPIAVINRINKQFEQLLFNNYCLVYHPSTANGQLTPICTQL